MLPLLHLLTTINTDPCAEMSPLAVGRSVFAWRGVCLPVVSGIGYGNVCVFVGVWIYFV